MKAVQQARRVLIVAVMAVSFACSDEIVPTPPTPTTPTPTPTPIPTPPTPFEQFSAALGRTSNDPLSGGWDINGDGTVGADDWAVYLENPGVFDACLRPEE